MKGVFIKGLKKSDSCVNCMFSNWAYDTCECKVLKKKKIDNGKDYIFGKTNCPVIETEVVR